RQRPRKGTVPNRATPAANRGNPVMSTNRLALVADDQRLATALLGHLKKALGQAVFHCNFDAVRNLLTHDADGFLLLAIATPAEAETLRLLVQEICLQRLPPIVLIVEGEELPRSQELARLDPYVSRRLRWPDDAAGLVSLVQDRFGHGRGFLASDEETI